MKKRTVIAALLALSISSTAMAEGDLSRNKQIEVMLEMGSIDNGMYFKQSHLRSFVTTMRPKSSDVQCRLSVSSALTGNNFMRLHI